MAEEQPAFILHRAVSREVPDASDFRSMREMGGTRASFDNDAERRAYDQGISTWISITRCRRVAASKPELRWIARLNHDYLVTHGIEIVEGDKGHRGLYGDREVMVASILDVVPLVENE